MTADDRLLALETTFHQHQLDDARVMAQIPLQLEAIHEGIKQVREDLKAVRDTQDRHSTRILALEQRPTLDTAVADLAVRISAFEQAPGRVAMTGWRLVGLVLLALALGAVSMKLGIPLVKAW